MGGNLWGEGAYGAQGNGGSDYTHSLDCGNGFMSGHTGQNLPDYTRNDVYVGEVFKNMGWQLSLLLGETSHISARAPSFPGELFGVENC